jgi:S1-C subfamily serine protease
MSGARWLLSLLLIVLASAGCGLLPTGAPVTAEPARPETIPTATVQPARPVATATAPSPAEPGGAARPILPDIAAMARQARPATVFIGVRADRTRFVDPETQAQGVGSGFILDSQGHIVTNQHVVAGARQIKVALADGRTVDAGLGGADEARDLFVLWIEGR